MANTYTKSTLTRAVLEEGVKIRIKSKEHNEAFQKACFKLGAVWAGTGRTYVSPREVGEFIFVVGCVTTGKLLMTWGTRETSKKRPDYRRIFFNDGENKDMQYEPFDLERALAGEPVVTRDGREVAYVMRTRFSSKYPIIAVVVDGKVYSYTKQGRYYTEGRPSKCDLFMYPQYKLIHGVKVPTFPSWIPDIGDMVYVVRLELSIPLEIKEWRGTPRDMCALERGLVFPYTDQGHKAARLLANALVSAIQGGE